MIINNHSVININKTHKVEKTILTSNVAIFNINDEEIKSLYPELTKSAQSIINKNQLELGLEEPNKEAIEKRNKEIEIRLYELEDETFF